MRHPVRLALGVIGLATFVYGLASLTGGWLGTPSWWEEWTAWQRPTWDQRSDPEDVRFTSRGFEYRKPGNDREWIAAGLMVFGLGLSAVALSPRKPRRLRPA